MTAEARNRALTTVLSASLLTAWCFVGADATRRNWQYIHASRHVLGAFALYTIYGALLGVIVWLVSRLDSWLTARLCARWPRSGKRAIALTYAGIAALSSLSTAFWTFSGEMISKTPVARVGPYLFMALIGVAAAVGSELFRALLRAVEHGRTALASASAAGLFVAASGLVAIDLTMYVALYPQLHSLLEIAATLLGLAGFSLLIELSVRRSAAARVGTSVLAGMAAISLVCFAGLAPLRTWLDDALRHVFLEELYAGRVLRRVEFVEAFAANPLHWRGFSMARVERLRTRYEIPRTDRALAWREPLREPPELAERIRALRGARRDLNIVVFYVDTLRNDVARDRAVMPNLARFAGGALDFRTAYATGSDTLRSLPGITGGNYDLHEVHPNDLLAVARRSELVSVLFIAQSAYEFLSKLRPSFRFEKTVQIPDYSPSKTDVWGYGADGPTAGALVDRALAFLDPKSKQRSLLWLFNFDQHNWRELDEKYVQDAAKKYAVPEEGAIAWRYRVVARAIDAEFGRLLDGLEQKHLADRTIVVFLSDHGEALGRDGFWVHSVFLWECLVRVPLVVRIPGVAPRSIHEAASLADLAPTLARYIERDPPTNGYQGEDLLGYLFERRPRRRLPILMSGASKDALVRVGMLDDAARFKLVLSLESALPELYDLSSPDPDAISAAELYPERTRQLLNSLARSPVFPRAQSDFEPVLP